MHGECCPRLFTPTPGPGALRCDAVIIGLGDRELDEATAEGHRRCTRDGQLRDQQAHRFGMQRQYDPASVERINIAAAGSELAVARWLGREWAGRGGLARKGDVDGGVEVRWTDRADGSLILHPDDDALFVLVTGQLPAVILRGWMYATDAKRPDWWRADVRHPAWFVPQAELHDLRRLVRA